MAVTDSPRERVNKAIRFQRPDRTPRDFAAAPEIWEELGRHFGVRGREEILLRLKVDCRVISCDEFCAPPELQPDGSTRDVWGARRVRIANDFGVLEQLTSFPLASISTLDGLRQYPWPRPDWWHFEGLRPAIEALNQNGPHSIRYRIGSVFETAWSIYNLERFLLDLAQAPALPKYVMERIAEVHVANLQTVMEVAADLIDIVYFFDDVATQTGLLMSARMYESVVQPFHQKLIDVGARHGKPVMLHCCGSVYPLIPRFIDMGVRILNPIQPSARNMDPERLAGEFGGRLAFHGGIDVQQFLPRATPGQVKEKVAYTCELLGRDGGYIMAGSHHIQPDTPIENVLAMYGDRPGEGDE